MILKIIIERNNNELKYMTKKKIKLFQMINKNKL